MPTTAKNTKALFSSERWWQFIKFKMDILSLEIEQREDGNLLNKVVIPFINGKSLIEILKEIELEFDKKIAGAYDGISPEKFLYEFQQRKDKVKSRILECECGCEGC